MYIEMIMESEHTDPIIFEQIVEEATFDACTYGGEKVMTEVEDYIKILETEDHEPKKEFEESLSEILEPWFENSAKIYGSFHGLLQEARDPEAMRAEMEKEEGLKPGESKTVGKIQPSFMEKLRTGAGKLKGKLGGAMKSGLAKARKFAGRVGSGVAAKAGAVKASLKATGAKMGKEWKEGGKTGRKLGRKLMRPVRRFDKKVRMSMRKSAAAGA